FLQMFLTVYLSNSDLHFTEVPVTPETLCRDVVDLCKEPGETDCYLAETWRGSERMIGDSERIIEMLQRWGQQRAEVRFVLRHDRMVPPRMELTLAELQEMASRQQQQINVQQELLANKEQRLRFLKLQEQQASEQEKLRLLRENAENQEAKLRRVRALKGQVEQKRLSNSKLVEEIEQMNGLFQQKQRELVMAVSRVEELSRQLEMLHQGKLDDSGHNSAGELERLYKELQLRNKLNQEQSSKLQQQRDSLSKRTQEVAAMDRRVAELRERLWKKKAALQQKENLPQPTEGHTSQPLLSQSRVAAVGPYIQSPPPPLPPRQEVLIKPAYPDGTATLPKPLAKTAGTLQSRAQHSLGLCAVCSRASVGKVPPPVPSKPKPSPGPQSGFSKPGFSTGTFPGKARGRPPPLPPPHHGLPLPLPPKPDTLPAATVRPFSVEGPAGKGSATPPTLHKPQTLAASSIYSMYTQHGSLAKGYQGQSTLTRSQPRLYGKPVVPSSSGQHSHFQDSSHPERLTVSEPDQVDQGVTITPSNIPGDGPEPERVPRPLSPTKLLPFLSHAHRLQSDADLESLKKRLHHAPRVLRKRSSITEPEGPAGPNIQKLLYQKTTLAAMETPEREESGGTTRQEDEGVKLQKEDDSVPPLLPPRSPVSDENEQAKLRPPLEEEEQEVSRSSPPETYTDEYPPYPPPPYPITQTQADQDSLGEDSGNMRAPEVTGQVTLPPGKRTNLRKVGSERINHGMRVRFNPLALLLDSSLEGEYDLVQRIIYEVEDPSLPNDEGITALHNAVCAGHTEIVKFLVQFGVNVNSADSDGWTPLHCAASCNNVQMCKFLVESGAAVFATTYSDMQTAADKCEELEEGYAQCSQFLYGVQEKMGVMNRGVVYALWDYEAEGGDELSFTEGDCMTVLKRDDGQESEWWWARCGDNEGYIPRNLLGVKLREWRWS
uniref:Tumor protein p53 binding protein 2 n=1 Tax=Astyanax mexicanus TaxID=7994 RepID=A0A8B9JFV8_ASTMX